MKWKRTQLRQSVIIAPCIKKRTVRMKGAEVAKGYLVDNRKIVQHKVYHIYQKIFKLAAISIYFKKNLLYWWGEYTLVEPF